MTLQPGTELATVFTRRKFKVECKLGEGGQGEVYRVTDGAQPWALKWYFEHQATLEQRTSISRLVQNGAPGKIPEAARRFIWPVDLVARADDSRFGYLMLLIDTRRFSEFGAIQGRRRPQPGPSTLCEICYQLANSFRALHLEGLAYRDISFGNVLIDSQAGDILICDNDNVGIAGQSGAQVLGTAEFMAPEVILGQAKPSTSTDLHSLAVLLFQLWMWHHPFHGDQECAIRSWDEPAKRRIYGEQPLFIFDPGNKGNRPNHPDYGTVRKRWEACPPSLQKLFIEAFTVGLKESARRVTEGAWQQLFLQLQAGAINCGKCQAENLWEPPNAELTCWNCSNKIAIPGRLILETGTGPFHLLLKANTELKAWHLNPSGGREGHTDLLGQVVQHPDQPGRWGLRNLTGEPWEMRLPDGTPRPVPPGKALPLVKDLQAMIQGHQARIASLLI